MLLSVFSQGDKGTSWYIIWKGSVNVVTHGKVSSPSLPSPLSDTRFPGPSPGRQGLEWTQDRQSPRSPPAQGFSHHESALMRVGGGGWAMTETWLQGLVTTLHEGDDFGQLALVNDAPRAATIILREDNCHFLRVDKQDFNRIIKVPLLGVGGQGTWQGHFSGEVVGGKGQGPEKACKEPVEGEAGEAWR